MKPQDVRRSRLHPGAVPTEVREAARRLRAAGGQAWVVGGSVRDRLLARRARDWDLATDLRPEQVQQIFGRTHAVGARFGTVVWVGSHGTYEITTFRDDGDYSDGRRPDQVRFTDDVEGDLLRRDFTINALAYDPFAGQLLDPAGGCADLERGLIRTVGDPEERFSEDALRLLRAVRLAVQLDFEIERSTFRALVRLAPSIERISAERVRAEIDRLLQEKRPARGFDVLYETGLLRRILPELATCYGVPQNPYHAFDVFHHSLAALEHATPKNPVVRLAALLHDVGKPETRIETEGSATFFAHQFRSEKHAQRALRRLRYSNQQREAVAHLVRHHMFHYTPDWSDAAVRRFVRQVGPDRVPDLFAMRSADTLGNGLRRKSADELDELSRRIDGILAARNAIGFQELAVDGHDLMAELGLPSGPTVGDLLSQLLEAVLDDPALNERGALLELARRLHTRGPAAC